MHDRLVSALSRTSIRVLLALILLISAGAGVWAADQAASPPRSAADSAPPAAAPADAARSGGGGNSSQAGDDEIDPGFKDEGEDPRNVIQVKNRLDNHLIVRGRVDFNKIHGSRVAPLNTASAEASCVGCQTYVVALQINVYQRGARYVAPVNVASAVNIECSQCITVARAVQYTIPVDDLKTVPREVKKLARLLDKQLRELEGTYETSKFNVFQADVKLSAIIADFQTLGNSLRDRYGFEVGRDSPPSAPAPESAPPADTPSGEASAEPSAEPSASGCPTASADPSVTPAADTSPPVSACESAAPPGASPDSSVSPPPSATP